MIWSLYTLHCLQLILICEGVTLPYVDIDLAVNPSPFVKIVDSLLPRCFELFTLKHFVGVEVCLVWLLTSKLIADVLHIESD